MKTVAAAAAAVESGNDDYLYNGNLCERVCRINTADASVAHGGGGRYSRSCVDAE